jgi:hypothetical protein
MKPLQLLTSITGSRGNQLRASSRPRIPPSVLSTLE